MDFLSPLVPLVWIVGLALTGVLLAAGTFLIWHMVTAQRRRDDRRDARDLLRPNTEPKE